MQKKVGTLEYIETNIKRKKNVILACFVKVHTNEIMCDLLAIEIIVIRYPCKNIELHS